MGDPTEKSTELLLLRYEGAQKVDDLERGLGDVLDVKASILLVAVVFLVDVSKRLIENPSEASGHPLIDASIQVASLFLLAVSVVLIVLELWPRRYSLPPDVTDEDAWIANVQTEAAKEEKSQQSAIEHIVGKKLQSALQRCQENKTLNSRKSSLLRWAFWVTAPVVLIDLGTLVLLALQQLCGVLH